MSESTYIVGIDLGTTHSALAYTRAAGNAPIEVMPVTQLMRPGELTSQPLLPSAVYLPFEGELPDEALRLPWPDAEKRPVGELARWMGAKTPGRLVSSAKSWLVHPRVDRQAAILPWAGVSDVARISPVDAQAAVVRHLSQAWNAAHPEASLAAQDVIVTVPASFDEAARALTVTAIQKAGLQRFRLLEEPQAALYDFTRKHERTLRTDLQGVRLVLVVDVGGGTSDFTLVQCAVLPEGPVMKRVAVGEHVLLGGDNMDAALAHHVEKKLDRKLTPSQWTQLVLQCRLAKEKLLGPTGADSETFSIAAESSRLFQGTLSATLTRSEVNALLVDGFLPEVSAADVTVRTRRLALQDMGLPFAEDPALTRQLAAFIRQHKDAGWAALGMTPDSEVSLPRPDAILVNGGVFHSAAIRERLSRVVSSWWPDAAPLPLLDVDSLDVAVARGAVYSERARKGHGLRISGGTARAYFVALQTDSGAQAACLLPKGTDEGVHVRLPQTFTLTLGKPVQIQLYSSTQDTLRAPGELQPFEDSLTALPPIHTILQSTRAAQGTVEVSLEVALTDIGTLELFLVSADEKENWRLEFQIRGASAGQSLTVTQPLPAKFSEARALVEKVFGHKPQPVEARDIKQLGRSLEKELGPRENFGVAMLRELWGALYSGAGKRRRSADHERIFFQWLGFSLRPGFGYPLDAWRAEQTFSLFKDKVQFHGEKPVWNEFWILWRRVAAGLTPSQQEEIWRSVHPTLERKLGPEQKNAPKLKGVQLEGVEEMTRALAAFEHLDPRDKLTLGELILAKLIKQPSGTWTWSLGRVGARVPVYGSSHRTVAPEHAECWATRLQQSDLMGTDGAAFALVQLTRKTGDRSLDVSAEVRRNALASLAKLHVSPTWRQMVTEPVIMTREDEARVLGDSLPLGLSAVSP